MSDGTGDEGGSPSNDLMVTGIQALLNAFGCGSLQALESVLDDHYEQSVFIESEAVDADEGIEVRIGPCSTQLAYPFAIREIWSCLDDLEAEYDFAAECERLADEIEEIEGFGVAVGIDYCCDTSTLRRRHQRRSLDSGVEVQHVDAYPFKKPMSDNSSIGSWLEERFEKAFPGLEIRFDGYPDTDPELSLRELRGK